MGIDINTARLIIHEVKNGHNLGKVITLGRQKLFLEKKQASLLKDILHGKLLLNTELELPVNDFAEPFFKALGATEIHSLDASDFEGANVIQDLNLPLQTSLIAQYDTVIDGGTLEHVFNFPEAIKSAMKMVRQNGSLWLFTPCNNLFGHGFYQFSPDLFFQLLNEKNGFAIEGVFLYNVDKISEIFSIKNPLLFKNRITMINGHASYLFVKAKRINSEILLDKIEVMQSDYAEVRWKGESWQAIEKKTYNWTNFFLPYSLRKSMYKLKKSIKILKSPVGNMLPNFFTKINIDY